MAYQPKIVNPVTTMGKSIKKIILMIAIAMTLNVVAMAETAPEKASQPRSVPLHTETQKI